LLVNHQTTGCNALRIGKEFASRAVGLNIKSEGFEQYLQRITNPLVIIDDADAFIKRLR